MTYNNKQTKDLTEYQIKKIQKRKHLNFFIELDKLTELKSRFSKIFSDQIEILVQKFDEQGILFYSINIELPLKKNKSLIWQDIHKDIEEFINYIGSHIELIEFSYFSIELEGRDPIWQNNNKKEEQLFPLINGIIGVRSILGKNKSLVNEIKDIFIISFYDIKVKWLSQNSDVLQYWNFIIKQKNFKFHRFVNYSNFYPMIYGAIADEELKFDDRFAFGQENHFISDTMYISGIKKKNPRKKELILYFLNLFMLHNDMKIYESKIYSKLNKTKISWYVIYTLDDLKNNFNDIFDKIKLLYPQQLGSFNIFELTLNNLDLVFNKIKKDNNLLFEYKISRFDNIAEFKDGLFFFETKEFIKFDALDLNLNKLKTTFYIDCIYSELNSADFWLNFFYNNFSLKFQKFLVDEKKKK